MGNNLDSQSGTLHSLSNGLRFTVEGPFVAGRGKGHFWRPRFVPTGNESVALIVNDHYDEFLTYNRGLLFRSTDGGRSFDEGWAVAPTGWANGYDPVRKQSIILPYDEIHFDDPEHRSFRASSVRYDAFSGEISVRPGKMHIAGFPRGVSSSNYYLAPRNRPLVPFERPVMFFHGHIIPTEDGSGLITTMFGTWEGPADATPHLHLVCVGSQDGGKTWTYRSTIAAPEDVDFEQNGPGEASLARASDGTVLCVFRVDGTGSSFYTCRSSDDGVSWYERERQPGSVYGVDPALTRLTSGALVLRGGRPGLKVWVSSNDSRFDWAEIDVLAVHNRADTGISISQEPFGPGGTSAYGDVVAVGPNTVLLAYDCLPNGWKSVPVDSSHWNYVFTQRITIHGS